MFRSFVVLMLSLFLAASASAQDSSVSSRVETTKTGDLILVQEVVVKAPVDQVWAAFTTSDGWEAWAVPVAKVDFQVGGIIRTNYNAGGSADDEDANVLHVINYVPNKLITLQAEVSKNWPEILKEREKQMYNVITFEQLNDETTKVISFGLGYRDTPELRGMMEFFIEANEGLYQKLIDYLEE